MNIDKIFFEDIEVIEDSTKPTSIANQTYPYNLIASDRRFEELLYSIFKVKIHHKLINAFDSITLMTGVRDKGRDCILRRNGKSHGLIQCKKYERNYGKEDFGFEITRFVLYSLVDKRLIHDSSDFVYYIAVSKGFTADCSDFIDDFNNLVRTEEQLNKWISENLKIPSLKPLELTLSIETVRDVLSKIKVRKIQPQDIDIDLGCPMCASLVPLFFEVRTITDNSKIEELTRYLKHSVSQSDLNKELKIGSTSLYSERNFFEGIENSHIERNETTELFSWLLSEPEKVDKQFSNICLVAGNAGYGKTVLLKDLYDKCIENNIAVLGLKADKLYSYTISELQDNIGISIPIFDFIEECKKHFKLIAILIDQIDALSQSMSSDRSYLNVFKKLLDYCANDRCVKFVVAVRTTDLLYDPSLKIYKQTKTIHLKRFSEDLVAQLLKKVGIDKEEISKKLMDILRVANNLNIFSKIVLSKKNKLLISSIQELYLELWKQKVLKNREKEPIQSLRLKGLLYGIADLMFKSQRIMVSFYQFEDFHEELRYFESERIIKIENNQIQFFHQSFYDFVFAKQFVERKQNLLAYVKEAEQSIHIRSAVKMIILYLRDFELSQYYLSLSSLLYDKEIYFHIKHLLISSILSHEEPSDTEKRIIAEFLGTTFRWHSVFWGQAIAKSWFLFAYNNNLFEILDEEYYKKLTDGQINTQFAIKTKNACASFLKKFICLDNYEIAWEILLERNDISLYLYVLLGVNDWSNSLSFKAFEKYVVSDKSSPGFICRIIKNIAKTNIDYALSHVDRLLNKYPSDTRIELTFDERDLYASLVKLAPDKLLWKLFATIAKDFNTQPSSAGELIYDWQYTSIDLDNEDSLSGNQYFYRLLSISLKEVAKQNPKTFFQFFTQKKASQHQSIIRLLLFALEGSENKFKNQVFELFDHFNKLGFFVLDEENNYRLRTVFENAFPFFSAKQKSCTIKAIKSHINHNELYYRTQTGNQKRIFLSFWGKEQYYWMLRLPKDVVNSDFSLKRRFQELERRFKDAKDNPINKGVIAGRIFSPISSEVCIKMDEDQLLKSFLKYNKNLYGFEMDSFKGGLDELAYTFKETVQKNPSSIFVRVIQRVVEHSEIPLKYALYGLWGWVESDADKHIILPLVKTIIKRTTDLDSDLHTLLLVCSKLVSHSENIDSEIISFLISSSLDFEKDGVEYIERSDSSETSIHKLATKGINTKCGTAIDALAMVCDPVFEDTVFQTMDCVIKFGPNWARAVLFFRFAYLTRLNRKRAHTLFVKGINVEKNIYVIASSLWSLQYMNSYGLNDFISPYEKLLDSQLIGREDSLSLFNTLYSSYLHNVEGAEYLLFKMFELNQNCYSIAPNQILKHYHWVRDTEDKNLKLLDFLLDKAIEKNIDRLNVNFSNIDNVALDNIYNFLRRFVASSYFKISDDFINYLILQASQSPSQAIELFELGISKSDLSSQDAIGLDIEGASIKFIVNAFNTLTENDLTSKNNKHKLLSSFDKILAEFPYGDRADKVLEDLI